MEKNSMYSSMQIDAIKEVSNIGAGNGATALSVMVGKKIDMTVPRVNVIKLNDLINEAGETESVAIEVQVLGDIRGNILIIFSKEGALNMASMLTRRKVTEIYEYEKSALCEIGNIISASYMNAISSFTGIKICPSVPAIADDMMGAIFSEAFLQAGQIDEDILDIETVFKDELNHNLGAHFYYVPEPGSLERILKSLGVN